MNYHNITYPDMNNGDGLRVVLWLSGCSHHCYNCQNSQTWDVNSGIPFDESAKEELFRELGKDYISGLTLSGGDPLHEANLDGILDLVNEIRLSFPNKSIWIYSGYQWSEIFTNEEDEPFEHDKEFMLIAKRQMILKQCNVFIDGRYVDAQRDITLKWRGSKNQKVIDIEKSLEKNEVILCTD
ncbi:anaerobic ribonucleoside-triphosphate reductase activating protein [Acetivibrio ethanolgignens]|uniref:Anaerobic ribonucleoside-triphosphate reductase-activating protein n=1 Tax=Acetivibrio ethanolgignens TaxID=290052 RepID=A0A0V8QA45_9FIRM|nr:anaerobic ribonucleoside-triphosphate reductase activating protein [Acetivibrio ethanolgignens]KSV57402.1 anaerobic ribonucleoside-triphosphate reductase activating protein [Acetivibrio ethanolgignens]